MRVLFFLLFLSNVSFAKAVCVEVKAKLLSKSKNRVKFVTNPKTRREKEHSVLSVAPDYLLPGSVVKMHMAKKGQKMLIKSIEDLPFKQSDLTKVASKIVDRKKCL